jgi:hypothetical protein
MKIPFLSGIIFIVTAVLIHADETTTLASFLRTFSLDERTPYQIPVAFRHGVTTLVFPESPQNFAAARIAFIEAGQSVPDFTADDRIDFVLLMHRGATTCSIRAVRPQAQDTLSVFLNGKVYQLFLHADDEQPLLTVEFNWRTGLESSRVATVSPNRLIDCLTRAKAYPVLKKYYPDQLNDVSRVTSNRVITYPDFRVQISEVFRFENEDTLIFHILLENRSERKIPYQPSELSVRVEPQTPNLRGAPPIYDASVVDASGVMPPKSVTSAWFAVTGTRNGGRNDLDPARNTFTVLVPKVAFTDASEQDGASLKTPPSPADPKDGLTR